MNLGTEADDCLHRELDAARRSLDALQGDGLAEQAAVPLARLSRFDRDAGPRRQPREKVLGRRRHVEIRGKVVEGADHGGDDLVERGAEALDERLALVQAGQHPCERVRASQRWYLPTHQRTRTWCS